MELLALVTGAVTIAAGAYLLGRRRVTGPRSEEDTARGSAARAPLADGQALPPVGEQGWRDLLDHASAVIYVKQPDGRYLFINRLFEELFHISRNRVEGHTDFDIFPPDVAAAFRANDRRVLVEGSPIQFDEFAPHDDGLHRYVSMKFPLFDAQGQVYALAGISTDVTERWSAVEERERIFKMSLDMICVLGFNGSFKLVNPRFVVALGYTEQELYARPAISLVHEDDRDMVLAAWDQIVNEGTTNGLENRIVCRDGTVKWVWWTATSMPEHRTIYAVIRDITARRLLERQLDERREEAAHLQRVQTLGQMAAEIAHELNQPLGAVINYARAGMNRLRDGRLSNTEAAELLERIVAQSIRAASLIRNMRSFTRRTAAQVEEVDLNALVTRAAELVRLSARDPARIRLDLGTDVPVISCDPKQIEQVVLNLARNGLDAIEESGSRPADAVTVSTRLGEPGHVHICVNDGGGGIDPALLSQIFEPFFTTKAEGVGMGLSISRSIVEAHGGRLDITSEAGKGTHAKVVLPIRGDEAPPRYTAPPSE